MPTAAESTVTITSQDRWYRNHTGMVLSVVELGNGHLASAGDDGTVQVWDPTDPDTTLATYTGHGGSVWSVVELGNGDLASAGDDGTVQVWDPTDPDTTWPPTPATPAGSGRWLSWATAISPPPATTVFESGTPTVSLSVSPGCEGSE